MINNYSYIRTLSSGKTAPANSDNSYFIVVTSGTATLLFRNPHEDNLILVARDENVAKKFLKVAAVSGFPADITFQYKRFNELTKRQQFEVEGADELYQLLDKSFEGIEL